MKRIIKIDEWVIEYLDNSPRFILEPENINDIKSALWHGKMSGNYKNQYSYGTWKFVSTVNKYLNTGNKTEWYTWKNYLKGLWCFVWHHDYRCAYHMDLKEDFEHCIRCERFGNLYDLPTLNLWFHWLNFRVWWTLLLNKIRFGD